MIDAAALLAGLPGPLDSLASAVLLEHLPHIDALLLLAALVLLALAFGQLHAFSRPPAVPLKRLPRRPTLHVLFKPDQVGEDIGLSSQKRRGAAGRARGAQQQMGGAGGGGGGSMRGGGGDGSYDGRPLGERAARHGGGRGRGSGESASDSTVADDDATTTTTSSTTFPSETAGHSATSMPHTNDLPDSFAPLLSSSLVEIVNSHLTSDLVHAVQAEATVQMRPGRHEIPLSRSSVQAGRPQFVLDVGKGGCKMTAAVGVGSDNLTTDADLDVQVSTPSRSRPMVKYATVGLDPPLPLANVAPTLVHFPTLFEDHSVGPGLRRIQLVRYAFDVLGALSSLAEKVLWILESRAQIHLSKVRITPFYKGDGWRLSLSFSGHLLLFGWIPVPFIGFGLPTFIIPQPHALLERLLTAQPLASAKLRRDNLVEEERIALAAVRVAREWSCSVKAVATPPAVGIDLTVPGGLTVAVEMMHGRDLYAGVRRSEGGEGAGAGAPMPGMPGMGMQHVGPAIGRTLSAESLSSLQLGSSSVGGPPPRSSAAAHHRSHPPPPPSAGRHNSRSKTHLFSSPPLGHRNAVVGATVPPPEPFDVNDLVPWRLELGMKGRVDDDRVSLTVTRLVLTHESQSAREGSAKTSSRLSVTGSVVIGRADPAAAAAGATGPVASHISHLAQSRKMPSTSHLAALTGTSTSPPSVCEVLLYPNTSPSASLSQRLDQFLAYDYAFDIADDTQLDAISLSIGATHPLLKGGTLITTVVETIYAYGSLTAREGAVMDLTERRRKRNILRHLPAVDFTAGIQNIFIPEESMSYSDDGQTRCIPELKGGRMMIRAVGGFDQDPSHLNRGRVGDTSFEEEDDLLLYVREGVKFCVDFAASSFSMENATNVNEFPELDILERSLMNVLLSGTFGGRIVTHLRPQNIQVPSTGMAPNLLNPLEAYEIDFTGSNASLKLKEGSAMLGHRRVICPTETIVELKIVESLVDMSFEGRTDCEVSWDFNGSSPILQTVEVGKSPIDTSHENRKQVELLIYELRQGRLNLQVSPVGGLSIKKAATTREDREGLYDWRFFNALVAPDDDSASKILDVIHDKRSMKRLLAVLNLINKDLERLARYVLTRAWRAKDIFDKEGVTDPGKLIPGHRMARLASLFLCGDTSQVDEILPIIQRVVAGNGLDVVKTKDLLRKNMENYDEWAPELDRAVRWVDTAVSPMDAQKPYIENHCPPLSELPSYQDHFGSIPSAREIYDKLMDKQQLPLDAKVSSMIASCAPYMTLPQIEFVLKARRRPSDWVPDDLRRIRYVYSIKRKVQDISESYGGLSFLPQSFFVSIFLGEATRASLRASRRNDEIAATDPTELPWPANESPGRRASTLTRLRRRRVYAPQPSYLPSDSERGQYGSADQLTEEAYLSPAGRVASQNNMARRARKNSYRVPMDGPSETSDAGDGRAPTYDLGDSLLGPQDVAILLQAGLTSSTKGSTVVQLNQRMLLDLMASQPRSFAVAVLAEIGTPGGQGSPRGLCSALMALLELDQSSFTKFHRIDMHSLLESWLPGLKIPVREDYLAGGRWARQSYYDSLFGVAQSIIEDAEIYSAVKGHVQRVRHHIETDPIPLAKELTAHADSIGIDIDSSNPDLQARPADKLTQAIDYAKERIAAADNQGTLAVADMFKSPNMSVTDLESCVAATELYRAAFEACAEVRKIDNLAFQAQWFKDFFRRNYDALMIKSVYDNIVNDVDNVRHWMDALRRGDIVLKRALESLTHSTGGLFGLGGEVNESDGHQTPPGSPFPHVVKAAENILRSPFQGPPGPLEHAKVAEDTFFADPEDRTEQEIVDAIIDALFFVEEEREVLRNDPLTRLLISNPPGEYDFTIVCAFGVITEGEKGAELGAALHRLEKERGVTAIRSDTGTARSFEYNASKIEDAIEQADKLGKPFGLLGYSQGCANALMAESLLLSGSPRQQKMLMSHDKGLVCRQMLFSAANGSMHGPSSNVKVQRLITMAEAGFKYQQGYCSRAFISSVLETLNSAMDSAGFQKFIGGAETFLPDGNRAFWREAQHLPHVPTTVLRGVLQEHTTPEALDMVSNLLTKQSGSPHHDSQVHMYDAVGHPVYTINRNGRVLEKSDMGGAVQRTHHWSPLDEEVSFVKTKRDIERAAFECAKDRHVFPWVDVNARFGIIQYVDEWVALAKRTSMNKDGADADNQTIEEKEEVEDVAETVADKL